MSLELRKVTKVVGVETHIHETSLVLPERSFNVLLGTTRSGKTTLMQIMAGLERPTAGEVWFRGRNVTGVPVQKRNVAMVYQQFINYPNFTVYENIASPLRVAGLGRAEIERRVGHAADLLRLRPYLDRRPGELSGGQQQRTAIARALVKDADLILLDEPLANLDYKLREELRDELPRFFAGRDCIVVYATTEPIEALLFGGNTATLHEGRITQFGPTAEIYRRPADLITARVFSDPPINVAAAVKRDGTLRIGKDVVLPLGAAGAGLADGAYMLGIRPHHIRPVSGEDAGVVKGRVLVAELSGSDSVLHCDVAGETWVSQSSGVHPYQIGSVARLAVDMDQCLFFDQGGRFIGGGAHG
jgi:glycerol transport system ATP-binding protein